MLEISPRVPLVRCPKCDHLLPELPLYSVYHCGGCGALSRADKRSSVDDGLSEKSWEERTGEVSEREGYGENVGFDRVRGNDRSATSSRARNGDAIRNSPIRESDSGDLGSGRKSSTKQTVLGDFDVQSKSSGRSMDGDLRKSPLRESSLGDLDGRGNSSVRSVRGGVRKAPIRESMPGDFDEQRSFDRDGGNPEEMEARVKVGAWIDHVEKEVDYEASADESEVSGDQVQPRRTWRLDTHPMDSGLNPMGELVGRRADLFVDETESEYEELYSRRRVEIFHDDWAPGGDHRLPSGHRDLRPRDGYVGEFQDQRDEMEQWKAERNEFGDVRGYNSAASVHRRLPIHSIDGPSNFHSYYGYGQPRHPNEGFSGSSSLRTAEMNRAELLRQFNELEAHLSRTGDFPENPTRRGHQSISSSDFYGGLDYDAQDELLRSRRSIESVGLDEHPRMRPHHMNNSQVPGRFANDRYMDDINSFPPSRIVPNEVPSDDDPSWPQYPGRTPHDRPHYYPQRSAHDYIPRRSMDSTYDPSGLTPQNEILHHPRNMRTIVQAPPAFGRRSYLNPKTDMASDFPDPYGESASGSRIPYSTPPYLSSRSQRSVDSKSDGGGSAQEYGKGVLVVKKNQLLCHPIAGAAPFVICYNCFQLLRVPKKLITMKKTQFRLQCGSCYTTLSFSFDKKKPPASMQLLPKPSSTNVHDAPSKMPESDHKNSLASSPSGITKSESYEFDATGYTFQSTDSELSLQLDSRRLNSSEAQKQYEPSMLLDNAVNENDKKLYEKETDASGHDNGSTITDVLNADAPTELDLNSDEIPIPELSQSSAEASSKNDGGGNKIGKSSSAGIIARAFRDLSPPTDTSNAKADVFVNGQPLPHRVVRKAEKLAGPISPGKYWYDSRAGFWGVMGSYCLGIIPPFIQEFGFPMPVNCAGGTTGIYVNGRELHEKDLQLLASRRFPLTRNKWYVIDISGRVKDEETGDVVVNMGKLAPSVEKAKHGFGMQPPEMQE